SQRAAASVENASSATSAVHHTQPSCASFSSIVMRASSASTSIVAMDVHAPTRRTGVTLAPVRCRAHAGSARGVTDLLLEDGLGVDVQADLVAHDHAAAFEHDVPFEAPVLAADLGGRAESGALVAPRGGDRAEVLEVERDR